MDYELLQDTIADIAEALTTPLTPGVMCMPDTQRDMLLDRGYTFAFERDRVEEFASEVQQIEETWVLHVVYCGTPEDWAARVAAARADARALRDAIMQIDQDTLNSIADGATTHESVTITPGNAQHDNTRQREGILVLSLPLTVTWTL